LRCGLVPGLSDEDGSNPTGHHESNYKKQRHAKHAFVFYLSIRVDRFAILMNMLLLAAALQLIP
jgi:hypothetical protein